MRVVIQCAARKHSANSFRTRDGRTVLFVARPDLAPPDAGVFHARPDDRSEDGRTWRQRLVEHNCDRGNALDLLQACRLYTPEAYGALVDHFGAGHVFILSAGWGLIPATFPTPLYDITFTTQAEPYMRRRRQDRYEDFSLIPDDGDDIVFLGGKDYLPLFCALTGPLKGGKTVLFNSAVAPALPAGFTAVRYPTAARTNWHYDAARALIAGQLGV